MSAHSIIEAASPSYDTDGYGWAMAQAQLLRERRFSEIDWDNVIEEIESVGKSEETAVESALRLVLMHQLKWEHQKMFRSRSWADSIREHLRRFDQLIGKNPGLKHKLPEILAYAHRSARNEAAIETGIDIDLFPLDPQSWEAIRAPREL